MVNLGKDLKIIGIVVNYFILKIECIVVLHFTLTLRVLTALLTVPAHTARS